MISPKTGGLGRALLAALTFHINVLEANRGYLPGNWDILWSLSVEEIFYLFFPLICGLLGRSKLLVLLLFTFVIIGPSGRTVLTQGNEVWREYSYLGGMDAIALGCLTALLVSGTELSRPVLRAFAGVGTALLIFSLCFSNLAASLGLRRAGLDMTIVAVGTCMIVAASAQAQWTTSPVMRPLLALGQRSYEVYLTHMFVVFALFQLFLTAGKPMGAVPVLFIAVILIAGVFGKAIAHFYSEPMNRLLRNRWGDGRNTLGAIQNAAPAQVGQTSRKLTQLTP